VLLDTESEIARVAYPKLILDMVVIKLATMTPALPADELLRRLDGIGSGAGGGGNTSTAATAAPVGRGNGGERAPRPQQRSAPAANNPVVNDANGSPTWEGFVEYVRRNKITMLAYVESALPPQIDGDALRLRVPTGHFYDYLSAPVNLSTLKDLAQRFFTRALQVVVEPRAVEPDAPVEPEPSAAELHDAALNDPSVKAAMEILGGEIQEIRQRRRPRKDGP
jgi:DNA polymerase-3 subunit gamma/tau